jgi:hypothetical protein
MRTCAESRNMHQYNARARKVETRRDRRLRRKRKSPQRNLTRDKRRALVVGSWRVHRDGPMEFLLEQLRDRAMGFVESRKKIDCDRKRDAIKALKTLHSIEVNRLSRHGCILRWNSTDGEEFETRIRENDCLLIDDWQWVLDRPREEQELIFLVMSAYEGIRRRQIEHLLDKGSTLFESDQLGMIRICQNNGMLHTKYLPATGQTSSAPSLPVEPAPQAAVAA